MVRDLERDATLPPFDGEGGLSGTVVPGGIKVIHEGDCLHYDDNLGDSEHGAASLATPTLRARLAAGRTSRTPCRHHFGARSGQRRERGCVRAA